MNPQFRTPEEEIAYLRQQVQDKMDRAKGFEDRFTEKDSAHEAVREYKTVPTERILAPEAHLTSGETHKLLEWLSPRETDDQVRMLSQVMAEKGIRNAFHMAEELNDPQVEDDFESKVKKTKIR